MSLFMQVANLTSTCLVAVAIYAITQQLVSQVGSILQIPFPTNQDSLLIGYCKSVLNVNHCAFLTSSVVDYLMSGLFGPLTPSYQPTHFMSNLDYLHVVHTGIGVFK